MTTVGRQQATGPKRAGRVEYPRFRDNLETRGERSFVLVLLTIAAICAAAGLWLIFGW